MAEEDTGVTVLPSPSGSKLDVHWGVGREVFLGNVVVRTGEEVQEAQFGSVQWQAHISLQVVCCLCWAVNSIPIQEQLHD